jgi:hypothetical protein
MKEVKQLSNDKLYIDLVNIIRIANKAVKKAKEENIKFGIPDTFWKKGNIYYVLSNGEITMKPPPIMRK